MKELTNRSHPIYTLEKDDSKVSWDEGDGRTICSVLQCVAVCCSVLQCFAVSAAHHAFFGVPHYTHLKKNTTAKQTGMKEMAENFAVCGSVLQRVAVCCSVCSILHIFRSPTFYTPGRKATAKRAGMKEMAGERADVGVPDSNSEKSAL